MTPAVAGEVQCCPSLAVRRVKTSENPRTCRKHQGSEGERVEYVAHEYRLKAGGLDASMVRTGVEGGTQG